MASAPIITGRSTAAAHRDTPACPDKGVCFWRVLRDRPAELARLCALTPHSRAEHAAAGQPVDNELEQARRVWVQLTQGRSGGLRPTGWKRFLSPAGPNLSMPGYLSRYTARMPAAAIRLAGVSLECRPALEVIADYGGHPDTLLYVDPPYLRTDGNSPYRHPMHDQAAHRQLADALRTCRAHVVVSGYPSALYDDLYAGWHHTTLLAATGRGSHGNPARRESLWTNTPPTRTSQPPQPDNDQPGPPVAGHSGAGRGAPAAEPASRQRRHAA